MKKKIYIPILIGIVITTILFIPTKTGTIKMEDKFIAHAGGELNGTTYTNCLNAINQSIEKGYKYIEIDLVLTSDSMIIAAHTWDDFNRLTGRTSKHIPTYKEAMSYEIDGEKVLDAKMITEIFKKNPNVIFITDNIDNPKMINQKFSEIKRQMMVEAFSVDAYFELKKLGFMPMLSRNNRYLKDYVMSPSNWSRGSVDWVVASYNSRHASRWLNRFFGMNIAIFTVNDYEDFQEINDYTNLVYTDNLLCN